MPYNIYISRTQTPKIEVSNKGNKINLYPKGVLYTIPLATTTTPGAIIVGSNLTVDVNGVVNASGGAVGSADWGTIGGNIADQSDLQSALATKSTISGTPVAGRVPVWDAATSIKSFANFTYDGSKLTVNRDAASSVYQEVVRLTASGNYGGGARLTIVGNSAGGAYIENNSGYSSVGLRTGTSFADMNIVNANEGGEYGAINFFTNDVKRVSISPAGDVAMTEDLSVGGNLDITGEVTSPYSSDKRLKENIESFKATEIIEKLNPVTFNWNEKAKELNAAKDDKKHYGFIAQDLEQVLPDLISSIYSQYKGINDKGELIAILAQAIKEQSAAIKELKDEINDLRRSKDGSTT